MSSKLSQMTAVEEDPTVDSSPMIDMVFQLILFFMVSSRLLVNQIDPRVEIPVASNAKPPEIHAGRIIVHIYDDGTYSKDNKEPLADMSAITDYVSVKKEQMEQGVQPKILLRGDKRTVVRHSKKVVQAAGDAGVNSIIFSAFPTAKK
jgi:biopolymer transport protein ExbD